MGSNEEVITRSKARSVLDHSNTEIVGLNAARGMTMFFCVVLTLSHNCRQKWLTHFNKAGSRRLLKLSLPNQNIQKDYSKDRCELGTNLGPYRGEQNMICLT
jgi:hypothetical protein